MDGASFVGKVAACGHQDAHKGRPYYGRGLVIIETFSRKRRAGTVSRVIEADLFALLASSSIVGTLLDRVWGGAGRLDQPAGANTQLWLFISRAESCVV